MLQILNKIPETLFGCRPTDVLDVLGQPTLFHFGGKKRPAIFISALIHGNETTGFQVFQELIKRYGTDNWPRETYFFIGNVWAAKVGRRKLDHQPDFNRVWVAGALPENQLALDVMTSVNAGSLFAVIDIHNNTGRNPHYAITQYLDARHLNLAALFADTCLYFSDADHTLSHGFGKNCPAVTIEAGLPGNVAGFAHVLEFVTTVMNLHELPATPPAQLELKVLHSLGELKLEARSTVGIGDEDADIRFARDFDLMNFKLIPAGTVFGEYRGDHRIKFFDDDRQDVTDKYLEHRDGKVITRVAMVPTMLKTDKDVLKNNCVGYAMREMESKKSKNI